MITMTGGSRTRTKVIINGETKMVQTRITKIERDTQRRMPKKRSLLLKSKIRKTAITLTKMIRTITCDIRTTYVPWMHTYLRPK